MDQNSQFDDKLKRKRELANARLKRFRKKKRQEMQQQNLVSQNEPNKQSNEQTQQNELERQRELAKEHSGRYRNKKRLCTMKTLEHAIHDSQIPEPSNLVPPANTTRKAVRIATQSLVSPHIRNIALTQMPQQQQQQEQQQQQSNTLVLKPIPLKVKQVAPTTVKMPPRQPNQGLPHNIAYQQPKEVYLRWNNYHSNMQNSFPSLLDSEQFVDVTLACEGRSLKCHKMILSSCSDYLAELLRENPCQHPIILIKDIKFWAVKALIKFMYCGEVNIAHDKLPQLLNAAETLQVKGLAGPNPSLQNPEPPLLIPQPKPATTRSVPQAASETKRKASTSEVSTPSRSKRAQKRKYTESIEPKSCTKMRLERPETPTSPTIAIKMEFLDIPLSPTIFPENNGDSSNLSNCGNLMSLHKEDNPGGNEIADGEREINFCKIPEPPDINGSENRMGFLPTEFVKQEQDIVEETETASVKDNKEESRYFGSVKPANGERSEVEEGEPSKGKKPV